MTKFAIRNVEVRTPLRGTMSTLIMFEKQQYDDI